MNDIVSFLALAGLSVLTLAAVGWASYPRQERLPARELSASDWAGTVRTGVRVVATWGPRLTYQDRVPAAPVRQPETCGDSTA